LWLRIGAAVVLLLAGFALWQSLGSEPSGEAAPSAPQVPARAEIDIYLRHDITDDQRAAIEAAMRSLPGASGEVRYESREQAWDRYVKLFADSPNLLANVPPLSLPASLRISMTELTDCAVLSPVLALPGAQTVRVVDLLASASPAPSPLPAC
jgi:cell division protein FtsX